ncbi:MAG: hypothetical protein JXR44_03270, partial [Thiotrichales bacterium]|nr:hypothetical protein [Thiotrichales bacterium]
MKRELITVIKQSTHRWIKQTGVFAALSAAMVYAPLSLAQFPERALQPEQWQAMGAQTAAVEIVSQLPSRPYSALALMPWNRLQTFSSPVSGQLIRLNKVHGEVQQGEAIAVIESAQLAAMQSDLLAVQAELTLAKQSLSRTQQLQNTGVASSKQLQQAQAEVNRLAALNVQKSVALKSVGFTAAQLERLLQSKKVEQTELVIVAPMDGALFEMSV